MASVQRTGSAFVSDADMHSWMALGQSYLDRGAHDDALRIFMLLAVARHQDARVLSAVGSTYMVMRRWSQAAQYFGVAQLIDLDDPIPTFHFARCLSAMGSAIEAREAYDILIAQIEGVSAHATLRARAILMRDALPRETSKECS